MKGKALTTRGVETAKPRKQAWELMDKSCPGFGVRISPAGGKSWIYRFRLPDRRLRRVTLGEVGAMTLAQARDAWRAARAERNSGLDPFVEKRRRIAANVAAALAESAQDARDRYRVADLARDYLVHAERRHKAWREEARLLRREVLPGIGELPAHAVTEDDIKRVLGVVHKRAPVLANRVRTQLSMVWRWALARPSVLADGTPHGIVSNPVAGIQRDALERWAAHLEALQAPNVVPMERGA